jgi:hypothetical protein
LPRVATRLARFLACFSYRFSVLNQCTEKRQANSLTNLIPQPLTVLSIPKPVTERLLPRVATRLARFLTCFSYRFSVLNQCTEKRQANSLTNLIPQSLTVLSIPKPVAERLLPLVPTRLARFLTRVSYRRSVLNPRIEKRQANCLANLSPQRSAVAAGSGFVSHHLGGGEADAN